MEPKQKTQLIVRPLDGLRERMPINAYGEDLAYIHDVGHGGLAKAAARRVVEELRAVGFDRGCVVDLGCGSGLLACDVSQAGYHVIGIDISGAMVALARNRAPNSEFFVSSFVSTCLPASVAITAIGEVLNYAFDEGNTADVRNDLFERAYRALLPGGLLMFDVAGFNRAVSRSRTRTFVKGTDWKVMLETELDETSQVLIRHITSWRRVGEVYRRNTETHRLILIDSNEVLQSLRYVGFQTQRIAGYSTEPLPQGLTGFLSRKP